MVNISKTKRNFIALNTLFAILSGAAGAVILHIALPGHYFGGACRLSCQPTQRDIHQR